MNKTALLLLLGAACLPTGCTLAPDYARPAAPVPAGWPAGAAYAETGAAADAAQADWQSFFTDGKLRQVIGLSLTNNLDLRAAALNVELARAMYGIRRAGLLPAVDAAGGGSRQRLPADLSSSEHRQTSARYDAGLGVASWEIDLFGRIRSLKDRALREYLASGQARRGARVLLVASVAEAYLALAADREGLLLAETTLASQRDAHALIRSRLDTGIATELDLCRAQTQVDAARGDVAAFTRRAAQDENALRLLAGCEVPAGLLPERLADVEPPRDVRAGLPSDILLSRPDVAQAEELLRAAYADVGAARAAFFPRVSLTAAFGTASGELSGLFKPGSGAWSYAPQVAVPVFDARTWSALRASKVQQKMAVTQYERAVQAAFRDVADALAARGAADRQVEAQESLVAATAAAHRLSASRYDKGIDSYLSVLDAQRSLYAAQQGLVSLRLAKLANLVRLYAALGGGPDSGEELQKP